MKSKYLLSLTALLLILLALPLVVFYSQKPQETRSRASASSTLYFIPQTSQSTPLKQKLGEDLSFDVMLDPGQNQVTNVKLDIVYDKNYLQPSTNSSIFTVNTQSFPQQIEQPVNYAGNFLIALSIGSDPTKTITQPTKVGTLKLNAKATTSNNSTIISFGYKSQILSSSSNDQFSENVLSTTRPAYILVTVSRCEDGVDNDNNGAADKNDSTCHTDGNPLNPNSYDPHLDGEHGGGDTCSDSKDNNNNGSIDGGDPVCHTGGKTNNPWDPNLKELATKFKLDILLHGIGNSGDNVNPTASSLSNKNPLHPERDIEISIFNEVNEVVSNKKGKILYAQQTGSFKGSIDVNDLPATGIYTIKLKSPTHLIRQIPGIQSITLGTENNLQQVSLIAGDINSDNTLSILDYNILIGCYSDLGPAAACQANMKEPSDLNDDGDVNQFDYNLFLREITVQNGQ